SILPPAPGAHSRGLGTTGRYARANPAGPCEGSKASRRYAHTTARPTICGPFKAAAENRIGTTRRKPTDMLGSIQSRQTIATICSAAPAHTTIRWDSTYARKLSKRVMLTHKIPGDG